MHRLFLQTLITSFLIFSFHLVSAKETSQLIEPTNIDWSQKTPSTMQVTKSLASMPLTFTENQGQWDDKVKYRANAGGATMWFAPDGAYYQFTRSIKSEDAVIGGDVTIPDMKIEHQVDSFETMMIKANFVGANAQPVIRGLEEIDYKCNYFIGNDESKWVSNVPSYSAVMYKEVYDGIDLKYYGNGTHMEYDFIVEPFADFSQIQIAYEGAESVAINDKGQLVVTTMWGEVVEQKPLVYQVVNGEREIIHAEYSMMGENNFGFKMPNSYNKTLALVIDPVLSYSTYIGGGSDEFANNITVDRFGSAYITGKTTSTDFPTMNPYNGTYQASEDVFVTKLSASGNSLVYSTYLGGSSLDTGWGITVDSSGNTYITGSSFSSDFPMLNAYSGTNQGLSDVFVTKLNSSGDSLVYSTYIGGSSRETAKDIAIDEFGRTYVTGFTSSQDFPTLNSIFGTLQGNEDVFVTKLSSSGNSLVYSTYLGGTSGDYCKSIAIDTFGSVYITGVTFSSDFPTFNSFSGTKNGNDDAFVSKISPSGDSLVYSTYLGGDFSETGESITVDETGAAYVTGPTNSSDFPVLNPYIETKSGGTDCFVTKLNPSGNSLVYSTYLGGSKSDLSYGIVVDTSGSAYVTGYTYSSEFPILNPHSGTYVGVGGDAFVTKFSPSGNSLIYSTFLGGSDTEVGWDIALDTSGAAYITGHTRSVDLPVLNQYSGTYQGGYDIFVSKVEPIVSCCVNIRGNINSDILNQIDIADLVFLVAFMFQDGANPSCLEETNIDGTDGIDIADLVDLVAYMFQAGAAPATCP